LILDLACLEKWIPNQSGMRSKGHPAMAIIQVPIQYGQTALQLAFIFPLPLGQSDFLPAHFMTRNELTKWSP